jgi:hypothetical protein
LSRRPYKSPAGRVIVQMLKATLALIRHAAAPHLSRGIRITRRQ